jgi:hypothetical protein
MVNVESIIGIRYACHNATISLGDQYKRGQKLFYMQIYTHTEEFHWPQSH